MSFARFLNRYLSAMRLCLVWMIVSYAVVCDAWPAAHAQPQPVAAARLTPTATDAAVATSVVTASNANAASGPLIIGTHAVPPFIIKNPDGSWSGISIDLWREVATRLGLVYEIRDMEVKDLIAAAQNGSLDGLISLNVTAKMEKAMDLTHAFYSTGLAIAVKKGGEASLLTTLGQIFTARFAKLILALVGLLIAMGALMWFVERRRNEQFSGSVTKGVGAGLWWSAVTMTTVGYGDKAPVTLLGRLIGLVWMFAALIIISSFTASISAVLTVNTLSSSVHGPDDLPRARVGVVAPSAAEVYCRNHGISARGYPDAVAAVAGLTAGQIDAVVYEAPILMHAVQAAAPDTAMVLPGTFDNHGYAFGLKSGSALREAFNIEMLTFTASDAWPALLRKYIRE